MSAKNHLSDEDIKRIEEAVLKAEMRTSGEIKVHIEPFCKTDPMFRAKVLFEKLGLTKTRDRNGVLIYVASVDHMFAILGDKGIDDKVGNDFWQNTADIMVENFKAARIAEGIIAAVANAGEELSRFFPLKQDDSNELDNSVSIG